jgi:vitamin B12 transporter
MSALPGRYYQPNVGNQEAQWLDLADTQNINLSAGLGLGNFSLSAAWFGNRAANHFLYDDPYGRRRRKESNEIWDTGLSVSAVNEFSNLSKLILTGNVYYGDKNIPPSGYSELFDKVYDISARENIMLEMPRALHDTLAMEASASHAVQHTDSAGMTNKTQALTVINRWAWYPASRVSLRAGWDYRYAFVQTAAFHDRHDGGIYLAAEWLPVPAFTVIPSIKLAAESGGRFVPVPKLGLLWKPDSAIVVKNNYFRSFKFPDLTDLYWQDVSSRGDPGLKPEDGWGGDIGIAWNHMTAAGLRITLEQNAYVQWYDNSIHWYGDTGGWKPQNVGGSFFHGLDVNVRFVLPLRRPSRTFLSCALSGQYMSSYLLAYGYTLEADKRIPYMPAFRGGAHLELAWQTGSAAIAGSYTGLRYTEGFVATLPPYFLLTLNVNQKIGRRLNAFGVIRNALNQSYQSFKDYPMPGITVTLGINVHIEKEREETL